MITKNRTLDDNIRELQHFLKHYKNYMYLAYQKPIPPISDGYHLYNCNNCGSTIAEVNLTKHYNKHHK